MTPRKPAGEPRKRVAAKSRPGTPGTGRKPPKAEHVLPSEAKNWGTDVTAAVKAQDHPGALQAMALHLSIAMAASEPNVVAQIAARLQAVLAELHAMSAPKAVSGLDEIAKRRADRLAKAALPEPAGRPTLKRRT
jgi:hypothetical protein